MINGIEEQILTGWIEDSLRNNTHMLSSGYQGKILLYDDGKHNFIIKAPHGSGLTRLIHTLMLRHEYKIYQKLGKFEGCPKCYGMLKNKYLVLEYINGQPIRQVRPADQNFFDELFRLIKTMHDMGIAHTDLKRKDNLIVTSDNKPCIIDFGTAIHRKEGFHPLNSYFFNIARQFDLNAWIKHKYHNNDNNISQQDRKYRKITFIEKISGIIKKSYLKIKNMVSSS